MTGLMYFGTRAFMRQVRKPSIRPEYARAGWEESNTSYGGRRRISKSMYSHREYTFVWPDMPREEVRKITDYADGVHGPGLIYLVDAYAADQNILSQSGATPSLAGYDATPLGWGAGPSIARPLLLPQTDQSQGYPVEKARYTITSDMTVRPLSVPIPPGHVAWVGIHGDGDAAGRIKATPFEGAVAGTAVHPTILSVSTDTRVNTMVEGTWLELALDPSNPGPCTLAGLIVQLLPEGDTPETGDFISGQGHGGLKFEGLPIVVPSLLAKPKSLQKMSAKLTEVG